ncbi:MAG: hypothetical protein KC996_10485 [Phycisphaerales bacterium]|nr:hypothetical protein [Phycisphaerales bacterium]
MPNPRILTALLVAGLAAHQAHAQPEAASTADTPPPSEQDSQTVTRDGKDIRFNFHAQTTYYDEADFDDANGTIQSWRNAIGIGASTDLGDGRISLDFDAEFTRNDFTDSSGAPVAVAPVVGRGSAPATPNAFGDVTILTLSTTYAGQLDSGNHWFVGGSVSSARESGADFDDSIIGTVFGGYRHKASDTLELGLGIAIKSRLEEDVLVIPLPQIRYDMGGGWVLSSQRAGVKLMYAASDSLSLGVAGEYESRSFRLDTSNAVSGGAATETRFPIAFQAEYKPSKAVLLSGRVGASLGSSVEFFDSSGNSVDTRDFDTVVFFSFGGTIFF